MDVPGAVREHAPVSAPVRSLAAWLPILREQRYRKRFLREDGRLTSIVTVVASVCFGAATVNDYVLLPAGALRSFAIATRLFFFAAAVIMALLVRRARRPREMDRALLLGLFGTGVVVAGGHLTRLPGGQIQGTLISTLVLLTTLYFAQRGPLLPRTILGGWIAVVAIVLLASPTSRIEVAARVTGCIAVAGINIVGVLAARSLEGERRKRVEAERHERIARAELAARLRDLAAEKERAEALAHARAAFLAAMSHEFRTPMNAVIGLSELLLDEPLATPHKKHVRTIRDSARALLALLEEILDFAKIDAQKLTLSRAPLHLPRLVTSIVEMLRPTAERRSIALSVALDPGLPDHVEGDDARLRQVLVNLVSNAVKFTERGSVGLRVSASPGDSHDREITFRVEDTGIGMSPEALARLFQPFEQADSGIARRAGGTGLGLAISQRIVTAMGSRIEVESQVGRGSVFTFTLRLPTCEAPPESAAPVVLRPSEPLELSILVVDDHPINREVAAGHLRRLGHEVDLASGGEEAILAASKRDYDVVFMDLQMPGTSGIEATRRLLEATADRRPPHVIALTASVYEEDREACRRAGMCDFVGKPIDLPQLQAVLCRAAEERGAGPRVLSREALAKLRHIEDLGDPAFMERLVRIFLADAPERIGQMKAALAASDPPTIARQSHALASSSAYLGAVRFSEACAAVEAAAREGRLDGLSTGIDDIAARLVEVERALLREVARPHEVMSD